MDATFLFKYFDSAWPKLLCTTSRRRLMGTTVLHKTIAPDRGGFSKSEASDWSRARTRAGAGGAGLFYPAVILFFRLRRAWNYCP